MALHMIRVERATIVASDFGSGCRFIVAHPIQAQSGFLIGRVEVTVCQGSFLTRMAPRTVFGENGFTTCDSACAVLFLQLPNQIFPALQPQRLMKVARSRF